ncbi:MAG: LytTR family DNA-binding domain-containing protein [Bacteroidales bacterium]|jgi:two-component system LytT family response regulator|nr:LytTR family DNA-binding domain-containing protein [Bacteroidales bacterium]
MIRTILIEEEHKQRKFITRLVRDYFPQLVLVGKTNSIQSGLKIIDELSPDLILLGVIFNDGLGVSALRAIKNYAYKTIYLAASEEHAIRALRFHVLDYIIKPVTKEKLMEVINKLDARIIRELNHRLSDLYARHSGGRKKRLLLNTSDKLHLIAHHDIIRCEANRNYSNFYLTNGKKITVCSPLKDYEDLLKNHGFFRIHKSHIVNIDFIDTYFRLDGGHVLLSEGTRLPVADRKKASLLKLFKSI